MVNRNAISTLVTYDSNDIMMYGFVVLIIFFKVIKNLKKKEGSNKSKNLFKIKEYET